MVGADRISPFLKYSTYDINQLFDPMLWVHMGDGCLKDIVNVVEGLQRKEMWSLQMVDSSTKIPNGILTGALSDLGNFDECLQVKFPNSSNTGQYCLANIQLNITRPEDSLQILPSFLFAYCIPSSCNAKDLEHVLNQTWFPLTGGPVTVNPDDCQIMASTKWSALDIFSISLFGVFFLLCVTSTLYDSWTSRMEIKPNGFLRSFSLYLNGKRLLEVGKETDNLRPLNGIRFLSIAWIILGHRYFLATTAPVLNTFYVAEKVKGFSYLLIISAVLGVDSFFVLSGLLNAYHLLKILDCSKKFPAFKYYFHRYIRVTPALAVIILIYTSWYTLIGDGPIWKRTVGPGKKLCEDFWWPTLLYINNYYNPTDQCAGQSWYLAVDMQLYWVAPCVIIPCWRWPKLAKYYLTLLLLVSTAGQFTTAFVDMIRMPFTFTQDLEEYKRVTKEMYVPTHTRATPYIIGVILAFFLNNLKLRCKRPHLSKWTVVFGWIISITCCLSAIFGNYPFMQPEDQHHYNRLESSFFICLQRVAWGIGLSWIIFACLYGYAGVINSFLSWQGFIPLGRLTYCIFLTHLAVQQYQLGIVRTIDYMEEFNQVHRFFGDLVMAVICGAVLSLMFESPVMMIEKYFQSPKK